MATRASRAFGELYGDVLADGGIVAAMNKRLTARGSDLRAGGLRGGAIVVYASIAKGRRHSQVMIAATERSFSVDFWDRGFQYASAWSASLDDVVAAVVAFVEATASIAALTCEHPWIEPNPGARAHEQGRLADYKWSIYESMAPRTASVAELMPLIRAAARHPSLRQLLPFLSKTRLCFSRNTGYPYTEDCPSAYPLHAGMFRVARVGDDDQWEDVGDGSADEAVALLVANLPPGCGAAVDGTAHDFV